MAFLSSSPFSQVQLSHGEKADVLLFEYVVGRKLGELKQQGTDGNGAVVRHKKDSNPDSTFQKVHKQHTKWVRRLCVLTCEEYALTVYSSFV